MSADTRCMSRIGLSRTVPALVATIVGSLAVSMFPFPWSAASAEPATVTAEASSLVYTIKNGDYLVGIAVKLGVAINDLLAVNKLDLASAIYPGGTLIVPVGGKIPEPQVQPAISPSPAAPAAPVGVTEYVVKPGDYLVGVAVRHGVTLSALLISNAMTATSPIYPGTKLSVPAATLPIPSAASPAPAPAAASPVAAAHTEYIVKNGDYLVGIAANSGVTLKALLASNKMTVSTTIFPGSRLSVPPPTLPIPAVTPAVAAGPAPDGSPTPQQTAITTVMAFLHGELGKPYLFNSAGPDSYDCSGLVVAAFRQVGISLPHQSLLQSQKGVNVDWHAVDIQAGDLIFQIGSGRTIISHVGIAISSTQWIQAARSGDVVKVSPIPIDDKIQAVRRIIN